MNELVYTERALLDLQRLSDFLLARDPQAAAATAEIIFDAFEVLTHSPEIGRKVRGGNRELVISRGSSGYLALYRYLQTQDTVLMLAIRHQREVGHPGI